MKERLSRPTIQAAILLLLAAVGAMLAWRATDADWLDAWMPNIFIGFVFLAATITVLEWILGRDETRRLGPRLDRLEARLRNAIEMVGEFAAMDYEKSHVETFVPVSKDMLTLLGQWVRSPLPDAAGYEMTDQAPVPGMPAMLNIGFELELEVQRLRAEEESIMPPELVRAIDDYCERAQAARILYSLSFREDADQTVESVRRAEEAVVDGARRLGHAVVQWRGRPFEFSDEFVAALTTNHLERFAGAYEGRA